MIEVPVVVTLTEPEMLRQSTDMKLLYFKKQSVKSQFF